MKQNLEKNVDYNSSRGLLASFFNGIYQNRLAYFLILPAMLVMILVVFYPFLFNFRISALNLKMYNMRFFIQDGFDSQRIENIGLSNYLKILTEPIFWQVFAKTVMWTVINVVFHVTGGIFLAILLNRDLKFRGIYRTLLIVPWAVPEVITALTWRGMFHFRYGAINLWLRQIFGVQAINWLTDPFWGWVAVIVVNIWLGIPFMMIVALGGLQSISHTYYEAAKIDGASSWQQFRHITLPMIWPVMAPAVVLGTVWTFNKITIIFLITGRTLTRKVDILVSYVYRSAFELYQYSYAAAFSVIIFAILLLFGVTFMKYFRNSEGVRM